MFTYESLGGYSGYALGHIIGNRHGRDAGRGLGERIGRYRDKNSFYDDYSFLKKKMTPIPSTPTPSRVGKRVWTGSSNKPRRIKKVFRRYSPIDFRRKKAKAKVRRILFKRRQYTPVQHNDFSVKTKHISIGGKKNYGFAKGKFFYTENWDFMNFGTEGKQGLFTGKTVMSRNQLIGSGVTNNRISQNTWAIKPWELDLYSTATLTPLYTGPAPSPLANYEYGVEKVRITAGCVSMTNFPQEVELFYFLCKKDTDNNPQTVWGNVLAARGSMMATAAQATLTTGATATGGALELGMYDQPPPTHYKEFRNIWKTVFHEKFVLQPGDTRKFVVDVHVNKKIFCENLTSERTRTFLAGYSIVPYGIMRGSLVGIKDSSSVEVTFGKCEVGFYQQNDYTFRSIKQSALSQTYEFPAMVSGPTHTGLAQTAVPESIVNDVDAFDSVKQIS